MSLYVVDWYKGVIKPEYADDMERIWQARDWAAAEGDDLSALISRGLRRETLFIPKCSMLDEVPENSYDRETRVLCYGMSVNKHGDWWLRSRNMFHFILPFITERVLLFYGWVEDMENINTQMAPYFENNMREVEKTLREKSFEELLKQLW